jgi:prevent-host-death family protein
MLTINTSDTIPAGHFKTHCLALMDEIKNKRQTIIITKRGIPVAKLMPAEEVSQPLFGWMKDTVIEQGNILDPIDLEWESANE